MKEYIDNLVTVFREASRVLVNDGTLWVNLGDAYADKKEKARAAGVKIGDLLGLPWRLAFALQADGWLLRSEIIWAKPNPKPESVQNRPTKAHESIFLFSTRDQYYYDVDAIREPATSTGGASFGKQRHSTEGTGAQSRRLKSAAERNHPLGKNKRSVWSVPVRSFPGAHFAVFPEDLIRPCILAGCRPGGTVLDPFAGSGTTGVVAEELGRNAVLVELNSVYVEMQKQRTKVQGALVSTPTVSVIDEERAARIAKKRTQRMREKIPLFADQMEEITAEQVKAAADRHAEAFAHCEHDLQVRGDAFREQVRLAVSNEIIAELDGQRAALPRTPEYHADFWRRQWQRFVQSQSPLGTEPAAGDDSAGSESE